MTIAIAATPAAPRSKTDNCRIDLTGLDTTTPVYISAELAGQGTAKSPVFVGAHDGTGAYFSTIFPAAGSWAVKIRKASDDSELATQSVTVS